MRFLKAAAFGLAALGAGCTSLGPMPATTGVSFAPAARPDVEIQGGFVPGYYLSSGVQEKPKGAALRQLAGVLEPDRWLGIPGLFAGARYAGDSDSGPAVEPLVGYRRFLDDERRLAAGAVAYGTRGSGSRNQASYSATRAGGEAGVDIRLTPESRWVELHVNASGSVTGVDAEGTYCVDAQGQYGVDCPEPQNNPVFVSARAVGVYPSARAGLSIELARHIEIPFHGARIDLGVAGGTMPRVVSGVQTGAHTYGEAGATLSVGFGASR